MKVDLNLKAQFRRALFLENSKWLAIELIFKIEGKTLKQKYFAANTYKKRKEMNSWLRHVYEVITNEVYEKIPFSQHFDTVAMAYCNALNEHKDREFFVKTLPNQTLQYINLGFEAPFISHYPDLNWGELELLRLDAWNDKQEELEGEGSHASEKVVIRHRVQPVKPVAPKLIPLAEAKAKEVVDPMKSARGKDEIPF